jgi:hypothetical protein
MNAYQCPKCDDTDTIRTIETEIHHYKIYPNETGEKEYTGYSKVVHGTVDGVICVNCLNQFTETQLEEMIVEVLDAVLLGEEE